jgi:hypothetical protein
MQPPAMKKRHELGFKAQAFRSQVIFQAGSASLIQTPNKFDVGYIALWKTGTIQFMSFGSRNQDRTHNLVKYYAMLYIQNYCIVTK